jgi:hypothetical protein
MVLDAGLARSADFSSSNVLNNLKFGGMIAAVAHKAIGLLWTNSNNFSKEPNEQAQDN